MSASAAVPSGFVFNRVRYEDLDARQKEAFNFQKVSAVLADYGFVTLRLSSDWQALTSSLSIATESS